MTDFYLELIKDLDKKLESLDKRCRDTYFHHDLQIQALQDLIDKERIMRYRLEKKIKTLEGAAK